MADGLRRSLQDIDLGSTDAPFVLPTAVVRQAEEENRFILIGRPVMPRRQNLRAIITTMPRSWGFDGIVRGRIIEGRRFQFVFPSEEAMETVLRRGPWAYAERMLVLQRWTPLMDMGLLDFIPLWVQIRGIPFQYMNREVIVHIAREMGQYIQMEYNEELGGRLEFVRVRLNWNVNHPLKFRRNFQFVPGVNTLLKFLYERLRGFCEVCGLMTHDTGACVINNGGPAPDDGNDDNGDDDDGPELVPNQGIIIEEINDEANAGDEDQENDPIQAEYDRNEEDLEPVNGDEVSGEEADREPLFSGEVVSAHLVTATRNGGNQGQKRKEWMRDANGNTSKFSTMQKGEASSSNGSKRLRGASDEEEEKNHEEDHSEQRGAVGPEPPLPP